MRQARDRGQLQIVDAIDVSQTQADRRAETKGTDRHQVPLVVLLEHGVATHLDTRRQL